MSIERPPRSILDRTILFCLENKLVVMIVLVGLLLWGGMVAPFDWNIGLPRSPIPVDAIPDIGENQQIVFTEWPGRAPETIDDQITYPLSTQLMGIPGVKTVRTLSMFGFSTIYIIFDDSVDFYWSRARILERLNSLPSNALPAGVQPMLGPDATGLGQVFWYTLEGLDEDGNPTGGWDLHELRTIQDWQVRYALLAAEGISEVSSAGGFVAEYQVDIDPAAMRAFDVTINDVYNAVRQSNQDIGAQTIEINRVEYLLRGIGFIETLEDIESAVITVRDDAPVYVRDVANVSRGPATRRGVLDKAGAEAVGGVAVVRFGDNPLAAIENVKRQIDIVSPGLPTRAVIDFTRVSRDEVVQFASSHGFDAFDGAMLNQDGWLGYIHSTNRDQRPNWLAFSRVTIVPFYDRSGIIYETLGTLYTALSEEILVTIIVVLLMVMHLRSAMMISAVLPLAVLMAFIGMRQAGVDANVVALSGIAIAIGTVVDMGIIVCENILQHLENADPKRSRLDVVYTAASEVGGAVMAAVATTIIGFVPILLLEDREGKLFRPLAYTYIFALAASLVIALVLVPPIAHTLFTGRIRRPMLRRSFYALLFAGGIILGVTVSWWAGAIIAAIAAYQVMQNALHHRVNSVILRSTTFIATAIVAVILTSHWLPLGPERGLLRNLIFVVLLLGGVLAVLMLYRRAYGRILRWCLDFKYVFLLLPLSVTLVGLMVWQGFPLTWMPQRLAQTQTIQTITKAFPGLGKEFMPPLDEGSYLLMPSTGAHASIGEAHDVLQIQDIAISQIPEIEQVVGKIGRAESPLDPAPIGMIETVINYKPEYITDRDGHRLRFAHDPDEVDYVRNEDGDPVPAKDGEPYYVRGRFIRDADGRLIPDTSGVPFRQWRPALDPALNPGRAPWPGIRRPRDIWDEIVEAAEVPGTTRAGHLQPISARLVMLQSGTRTPTAVKITGPDLATIERAGLQIEAQLRMLTDFIDPATVSADRIVGKPYLHIEHDRESIARYGLTIQAVQDAVDMAVGGRLATTTVENRERYPVRVRYMRELRDSIEGLNGVLITAPGGRHIPLGQLADIRYVRGPQMIRREDSFLTGYVIFDKQPDQPEVTVVEQADRFLREKIAAKELVLPENIAFEFIGTYESQVRAQQRLMIVIPLALLAIFLVLYLKFRSIPTSMLVFTDIAASFSAGFILIWLYGQPWFLDFAVFGTNMREVFQIVPINLSVAIWVGFLALFGIATDDGVVMATYLDESFATRKTTTVQQLREATVEAGKRRIRPVLMTTATTILALIPVLTSYGRGADVMVPMAIPVVGGMTMALITPLFVPVLYCLMKEIKLKVGVNDLHFEQGEREGKA